MTRLQELIGRPTATVLPGAPNALTARLVEDVGFEAVYVTGAGIANTFLGVPDIGLLTLTELCEHVGAIREAVDIPLIVDADTGFGNAVNVWRTVRALERAGANAIQIEDQTFPKRCGHFADKSVIDADEMADKIAAACDARRDAGTLIVARTDARYQFGLDEACRRGNLYREAGADLVFVEAPTTIEEVEIMAREVAGPKILNLVHGGVTPHVPAARVSELGYSFALYANLALLASVHAMRDVLGRLHAGIDADRQLPIASWDERQRLVRKDEFDDLGRRYSANSRSGDHGDSVPQGAS